MFENLIAALKADKRKIVFTEGPDARILEAAARLKKDGLMDSILVGNVDDIFGCRSCSVRLGLCHFLFQLRLNPAEFFGAVTAYAALEPGIQQVTHRIAKHTG